MADKTSKRPRITTKCPDCGRKLTLRPGKPFEYRGKGEHRRTYTRARCVRCGMNAWLFPDGEIGMISYNRPISVKLVRGKKTSKAGRKSSKTSARKTSAKKTSKKLIAARKRVSKADSSLTKAKSRAKRLVASRKTAAGKAKARKTSKKKVAFFEKRLARAKAAAKAAKQ